MSENPGDFSPTELDGANLDTVFSMGGREKNTAITSSMSTATGCAFFLHLDYLITKLLSQNILKWKILNECGLLVMGFSHLPPKL
jgi:hypothetical protein